jgi:hypothetical protein
VRVCELGDELEIVLQKGSSILQRRKDQYSFVSNDSLWARGNRVQVDMLNRGGVDFERLVVVEEDGRLHVRIP